MRGCRNENVRRSHVIELGAIAFATNDESAADARNTHRQVGPDARAMQPRHQRRIGLQRLTDPAHDHALSAFRDGVQCDQAFKESDITGTFAELGKAGDGVAVGRFLRMTEDVEQSAFDRFAHDVLPATGFFVHEFPFEPDHVDQQALGQSMFAHHPGCQAAPRSSEFETAVTFNRDETVALHAGDGLRHGRDALHEPLGDPGPQWDGALFFQFEDRAQVHLDGVDKVVLVVHIRDCVALGPTVPKFGD